MAELYFYYSHHLSYTLTRLSHHHTTHNYNIQPEHTQRNPQTTLTEPTQPPLARACLLATTSVHNTTTTTGLPPHTTTTTTNHHHHHHHHHTTTNAGTPPTDRPRQDPRGAAVFFHSSSHVLGQALEVALGGQLTVGPALKEGFYYDCYMGTETVTEEETYDPVQKVIAKVVKVSSNASGGGGVRGGRATGSKHQHQHTTTTITATTTRSTAAAVATATATQLIRARTPHTNARAGTHTAAALAHLHTHSRPRHFCPADAPLRASVRFIFGRKQRR